MEKEYEQYGEEWMAEMMKWRKCDLVVILSQKMKEVEQFVKSIENQPI